MSLSDTGGKPETAAEVPPLGADERAELERLRAETAALHKGQPGAGRRRRIGWRTPVATLLIVVGCLLAPVAVLGVWSANQVSDTGRYVANIEPLVHDPAIQNALTDKVTNEITSHLDVAGYTDQAAALLSSKGLSRVGALLNSFGPSITSAVSVGNGQVVIDLGPFINIVKQDLSSRGFTLVDRLPPIHPTLPLFSSRTWCRRSPVTG